MKFFYNNDGRSGCVIITLLFVACGKVHSQGTCILDKNHCINDGRLGYCCSGHCFQILGDSEGYCMESKKEIEPQSCISDGGGCKTDGEDVFCCSGNCHQIWKSTSQSFGKCLPMTNTTTTTSTTTSRTRATSTSTSGDKEKCIKDNKTCHISGNIGYCCSGICFQRRGFETGHCQNKSTSVCLEDGDECHRSGSLGFCCSGLCNQTIDKIVGRCKRKNNTDRDNGKDSSSSTSPSSGIIYAIFGILLVLAAIAAGIAVVMYKNRLRRHILTEEDIKAFLEGEHRTEYLNQNVENGQSCNSDNLPYDAVSYEIDEKNFKIHEDEVLGEGAYGLVLKCTMNDDVQIAAKTVHKNVEVVYLKALLSELKVMIYLENHVNIVGLVGAYTKNIKSGLIYVFCELCPLGSLEKYLRENRDNYVQHIHRNGPMELQDNYSTISDNRLGLLDLLSWSYQLANGMDYLCQKKVIHGDLATRNILLMNKNLIKITDFGLSRRLYEYSNYVKKHQEPLPWRWMAIESLRELKFSSQSDVWSFGVTLWEIFSLGDIPYGGLSWTIDFVSQLLNGLRLNKPTNATNEIFPILNQCWKCNDNERPSFDELKQLLLENLNLCSNNTFSSTHFTFDSSVVQSLNVILN